MTTKEFIEYTKEHPLGFINYCEIIIPKHGGVELATPSHLLKVVEMAATIEKCSTNEIQFKIPPALAPLSFLLEKYGLIAVWYNCIDRPEKITRFQKRTLNILQQNELIAPNYSERIVREYSYYLNNKDRYI